jgi:hypothetical protein
MLPPAGSRLGKASFEMTENQTKKRLVALRCSEMDPFRSRLSKTSSSEKGDAKRQDRLTHLMKLQTGRIHLISMITERCPKESNRSRQETDFLLPEDNRSFPALVTTNI